MHPQLHDIRLAQARTEDLLRDAGIDTRKPPAKSTASSWAWPWFEFRRSPWPGVLSSPWRVSKQPASHGWQYRLAQAAARLRLW